MEAEGSWLSYIIVSKLCHVEISMSIDVYLLIGLCSWRFGDVPERERLAQARKKKII